MHIVTFHNQKMEERVVSYLGLGSNIGDRKNNISLALNKIDALPTTVVEAVSDMVESTPQGKWTAEPCGKFINCCCRITTKLPAVELLEALKGIERQLGRNNEGEKKDRLGRRLYSDRPIDIDILLYGDLRIDQPGLIVPHPRMHEREFVMVPLRQILDNEQKTIKL